MELKKYVRAYKNKEGELKEDYDMEWYLMIFLICWAVPLMIIIDAFHKTFIRKSFWITQKEFYNHKIQDKINGVIRCDGEFKTIKKPKKYCKYFKLCSEKEFFDKYYGK